MYPLFLETRAAAQIRAWCEKNGPERVDELLTKAYDHACKHGLERRGVTFDGYLFTRHVKTDDHQEVDIDSCFTWAATTEGQDFWASVNRTQTAKRHYVVIER